MTDLKFACRQLLKNPGSTAVALFALALGIGANATMLSVVHACAMNANSISINPIEVRQQTAQELDMSILLE